MGEDQSDGAKAQERLSVVLGGNLSEHVRVKAFLARTSKSGYVRGLIEADARRDPVEELDQLRESG